MKRAVYILLHCLFWIFALFFSIRYSFIRPTIGLKYEVLCVFLIASIIYLNYFLLYPCFLKKKKIISYLLLSLLTLAVITIIEVQITIPVVRRQLSLDEALIRDYIQSLYFFIFLRDLAFLIFFVVINLYRETLIIKQLEEEKFTIENRYLRSRIAPHYLYNVLNTLYSNAITKDEKLPEHILNLSKLLHYYIDESNKELVSLNDELNFYQKYIALENERYPKPLAITFNVDGNSDHITLAPLLFETMLNNAFKFTPKDGSGYINISFFIDNLQAITFSCENNKCRNNPTNAVSSLKGLDNLRNRLELLYPNNYSLQIEDKEDTYKICLHLKNLA